MSPGDIVVGGAIWLVQLDLSCRHISVSCHSCVYLSSQAGTTKCAKFHLPPSLYVYSIFAFSILLGICFKREQA